MARIATYVFLDLETTSLPREELNKTRITELSMVIVKRRHILETQSGELPRVQHKLTMCFNPGRLIAPGATEASGLDNDLLEYESKFNLEVFNTINSFLGCQEKPVCLVAENGHSFDFPILKNHFMKLHVSLDDDVMCADSLHAFYDILKVPTNVTVSNSIQQPSNNNGQHEKVVVESNGTVLSKDEIDDSTMSSKIGNVTAPTKLESIIKDDNSPLSFKTNNENTPRANQFKITPAKRIKDVRRKLFFNNDPRPVRSHYKLKNIYERVMCRPGIEAHRAENDCIMTAEIATAKAEEFVKWVDKNHCAFSEVKAMTLGVPLGY